MRLLGAIGRFFWRFMVIFSFIVNIVLVVVLLVAGLLIFEIKNQIAEPLVEGLHSSFVGLDQATIDWTIPVRSQIPVVLDIPLETDTVVVLTQPVPLQVNALIDLPGINAFNVDASVNLELPAGLELPVALDLDVAVDQPLDVELDVRAVIPLQQTQLHDVAQNLRLQLEPLAIALNNLPNGFGSAAEMVGEVLQGDLPNLLEPNDYSIQPWQGYSMTAGVGYEFFDIAPPPANVAIDTGIIPVGGMPFLDEQIRPEFYEETEPGEINQQAITVLTQMGIDPAFYRDGVSSLLVPISGVDFTGQSAEPLPVIPSEEEDTGIIPQTNPPDQPGTEQQPPPPPATATPSADQGIIVPGDSGG